MILIKKARAKACAFVFSAGIKIVYLCAMNNGDFEEIQPAEEKIAIYSKWAILGFSVFFSTFAGSVLMMLNLRRIGNKTAGYFVLGFGVAFLVVQAIIMERLVGPAMTIAKMQKLQQNNQLFYYITALNVLGGAILAEILFRRYFKSNSYTTRSAFPAFLVIIGITFLLLYLL